MFEDVEGLRGVERERGWEREGEDTRDQRGCGGGK